MIEKRLDAPHREGGDHDGPAALDAPLDIVPQRPCRVDLFMAAIAIGGLDQHIVRPRRGLGILHDGIAITPDIA